MAAQRRASSPFWARLLRANTRPWPFIHADYLRHFSRAHQLPEYLRTNADLDGSSAHALRYPNALDHVPPHFGASSVLWLFWLHR